MQQTEQRKQQNFNSTEYHLFVYRNTNNSFSRRRIQHAIRQIYGTIKCNEFKWHFVVQCKTRRFVYIRHYTAKSQTLMMENIRRGQLATRISHIHNKIYRCPVISIIIIIYHSVDGYDRWACFCVFNVEWFCVFYSAFNFISILNVKCGTELIVVAVIASSTPPYQITSQEKQ